MASNRAKKEKVEETGGELTSVPNDKYRKFFEKFTEIDTLDVKQWKVVHVLAYFCKKYKEAFNVDYQFKFNHKSPAKCMEVWRINQLCGKLSASPEILRNYIDWVFEEKVTKAKRRFTAVSFITNDDVVNYYKINVLLANKKQLHLDRSSALAPEYKKIMHEAGIQVNTYGDLAFFYQSIKAGGLDAELTQKFSSALTKMKEESFDESVLERII